MNILEIITGRFLLNLIGASVRWIYGTIWRTMFGKKKFTFNEYLYGPKKTDDWFDKTGHTFVNRVIGLIFMCLIIWIIFKLDK